MNLTSLSQVRSLLKDIGVQPSRELGQCFLVDRNILDIIVSSAGLKKGEKVLEVGPGLGVLTDELLKAGCRVSAVEKDRKLYGYLAGRLAGDDALDLQCADIMDVDPASDACDKVVSNLPYSVGSRFLVDVVRREKKPERIVVTVQAEVGDRITAEPDSRCYGLMSLWLQLDYDCEVVKRISPTCFWPRPEIDSVVVRMQKKSESCLLQENREIFHKVTKHAFMHRRKQLAGILSKAPAGVSVDREKARTMLEEMGVGARARPENLSVAEWCVLAGKIQEFNQAG